MDPPDRASLEGMRTLDLRALCKKHNLKQREGYKDKTKKEMIDGLEQHFRGPDVLFFLLENLSLVVLFAM
jgi:hypothetical protein